MFINKICIWPISVRFLQFYAVHYPKAVNIQYLHFETLRSCRVLVILVWPLSTGFLCECSFSPHSFEIEESAFSFTSQFSIYPWPPGWCWFTYYPTLGQPFLLWTEREVIQPVRVINSSRRCWTVGGKPWREGVLGQCQRSKWLTHCSRKQGVSGDVGKAEKHPLSV